MLTFSNKTVLVTGAAGLIGSHIVDALMAMGDVKVIALSRTGEKLERGFAEYLGNPNFSRIARDVCEPIDLPCAVDFIFHAASLVGGRPTAERPMDAINPNLLGTRNCLDLLLRQREAVGINGRLVLFSSVTIYGNTGQSDITVTEDDTNVTERLDTASAPYSQSKRMAEVIALAYCRQFGADVVIARPSTVYGPARYASGTVFYDFIDRAFAGEDIIINNPAAARRDNIYIDDAVSALLCVCQKGVSGQAYNVSSNGEKGNFAAVDEIARQIAASVNALSAAPREVSVRYGETRASKRSAGVKLDNAKLKALGWELKVSMEEGVKRTVSARKQAGVYGIPAR